MMNHTKGDIKVVGYFGYIRLEDMPEEFSICKIEEIGPEGYANAERIKALWNASVDLTNEQAQKYLKHGPEMERFIKACYHSFQTTVREEAQKLIEKLEG